MFLSEKHSVRNTFMVEEHEVRLKWYDRKGCLALLIFCWPVLLYALWKNRTLSKRNRGGTGKRTHR